MYIYGYSVTEDQQEAIIAAMKGQFTASDICKVAIVAGVPEFTRTGRIHQEYLAHRVVDGLLQRQRKAGKIAFAKKRWTAV